MVWLDSPTNEYRRRVLPLAAFDPGLGLAVAAISTQHRAGPAEPPAFSEAARDACLALLRQSAHELTLRLVDGAPVGTRDDVVGAECMLASMLMMTCYEMATSRVAAAECHRRAARTIVGVFGTAAKGSELFTFLRNQLAIHDVLASVTSFDANDLREVIVPDETTEDLFTEYLGFLHKVTLASRGVEIADNERLDVDTIRGRFEQARASTLMAATRLQLGHSAVRRDFIRLVETYHTTALLYSYRCLDLASPSIDQERAYLGIRLTAQLSEFEDPATWIQNMPWPVLVAGTEAYGDVARQEAVTDALLAVSRATNSLHHMDTLGFLQEFWAGDDTDWRPLARRWEHEDRRIIPV
ncbi:hypothetical protein F5X68DRAFT_210496 [Plectosphaerella plurivora]|uniref:Uncharacterized protein n=1 Tax=Plectosphaerella plurivora TaxID=936078 RepID=A0A9P9AAB0_9PEZI|nr:hypothetical protein F5X68DRAFT_210496 [Plectosphaerella plurivora]